MVHHVSSASRLTTENHRGPFVVDDGHIPWHVAILARIEHICRLQSGWDGYTARPVDFATAAFALRILYSVCSPSSPAPSIAPGVNGDLQIEWHTPAWDIEVHVLAPNLVEGWRAPADRQDADEESFKTTIDFTVLHEWLQSLGEPAFADRAAAAR